MAPSQLGAQSNKPQPNHASGSGRRGALLPTQPPMSTAQNLPLPLMPALRPACERCCVAPARRQLHHRLWHALDPLGRGCRLPLPPQAQLAAAAAAPGPDGARGCEGKGGHPRACGSDDLCIGKVGMEVTRRWLRLRGRWRPLLSLGLLRPLWEGGLKITKPEGF